jgi:hypothetical protein
VISLDSGLLNLIAILAPTVGKEIKEFVSGRGKDLKHTELQLLLLAKSIEDTAYIKQSIANLAILFQDHHEQEVETFKSIQEAMEELGRTQRRIRSELIEYGVVE